MPVPADKASDKPGLPDCTDKQVVESAERNSEPNIDMDCCYRR